MATVTPHKVVFGLKKVHYAVLTEDADGTITYATPVAFPGAVNLALNQSGDMVEFYADDISYWQTSTNNGYEGTYEAAEIPSNFALDVLGEVEDAKKVQFEIADAQPKRFALLAEFDTDQLKKRICLYNCVCQRPGIGGQTSNNTKTPETKTLNITARPIEIDEKFIVKASTKEDTDETTYNGWFSAVPMYTAVGG